MEIQEDNSFVIQRLLQQLKGVGNGAHIHTANKAAMYLEYSLNHNKKGPTVSKFIDLTDRSLISGDWTELKQFMRGWF